MNEIKKDDAEENTQEMTDADLDQVNGGQMEYEKIKTTARGPVQPKDSKLTAHIDGIIQNSNNLTAHIDGWPQVATGFAGAIMEQADLGQALVSEWIKVGVLLKSS